MNTSRTVSRRCCPSPARILRRVDLPEPLGPTRPAWSPSKSPNGGSSKSDRGSRGYFFFGFFFSFLMLLPLAMCSPPFAG